MNIPRFLTLLSLSLLALVPATAGARAETVALDRLGGIRAIAADPTRPEAVLLATPRGLFAATPAGTAERISAATLLTLAAHPAEGKRLLASGNGEGGKPLGLVASDDGGRTWRPLAQGADGAAAFRFLTVSPADPEVLFAIDKGLRRSGDGGAHWGRVGPAPEHVFALAASARDSATLYAATLRGLVVSRDGGRSWKDAFSVRRPATAVHVTGRGRVHAFVYPLGLFVAEEGRLAWRPLSQNFQDRALVALAADPADPRRLYAVADTGAVMTSADGGRHWTTFEGNDKMTPATIRRGAQLYAKVCESCHGTEGVGERPDDPYATDAYGYVAPPLNNDAHAWHHPDRQLVDMILGGSPRNERMRAFRDVLSEADAEALVVYIKSLWNFRSLACQGSRHMKCAH